MSNNSTIITIKKNKETVMVGYGILTKNPTQISDDELVNNKYSLIVWMFYDGVWYLTPYKSTEGLVEWLKAKKTYTKFELFDLVYEVVYGK